MKNRYTIANIVSFFFHLISIGKNFIAFSRYLHKYSYRYTCQDKKKPILFYRDCLHFEKTSFSRLRKNIKGKLLDKFANEKADSFTFILRLFLSDEWKKLFSELVGLLHD